MKEIEGTRGAAGLRIAIIASRFNPEITEGLVRGAMDALRQAGAETANITLIRVPGAFEIPLVALSAARSKHYDGIVAIGCVIRGETAHFEYISQQASQGIGKVALETGVPVTFGILTAETDEQAVARSQPDSQNKGFEAAIAVVEMANLLKQI
jgi:6,7-dimethyl-8-ribityllumazine synthase